ncbi:MAG: DUF559 domain-containing protein [Gammaproteobacteria bacterium]
MKSLARMLRRHSTDAEHILWYHLRAHRMAGYKFKRQAIIGSYIVDFVCFEAQLVIEADGGQHIKQPVDDKRRTAVLESKGFRVIRFWNHEILFDTQNVLREIHYRLIKTPSPQPSPSRRERE